MKLISEPAARTAASPPLRSTRLRWAALAAASTASGATIVLSSASNRRSSAIQAAAGPSPGSAAAPRRSGGMPESPGAVSAPAGASRAGARSGPGPPPPGAGSPRELRRAHPVRQLPDRRRRDIGALAGRSRITAGERAGALSGTPCACAGGTRSTAAGSSRVHRAPVSARMTRQPRARRRRRQLAAAANLVGRQRTWAPIPPRSDSPGRPIPTSPPRLAPPPARPARPG